MRDHLDRRPGARDELQRGALERARDAELVGVDRRRFRGRRSGEMDPRPHPDVQRERQRLAPLRGLREVGFQVAAGVDVDVHAIARDHHEALDRCVAHPRLGVFGDHHRGIEVGAAVLQRVGRDRQPRQVDPVFGDLEHRTVLDHDRGHRLLLPFPDAAGDVGRELLLGLLEELREQRARPVEAGEHRRVVPLDPFEQHGGGPALELGRDAGQIVHRVDLRPHADEPTALRQALDDQTEIAQIRPRHHRLPLLAAATARSRYRARRADESAHRESKEAARSRLWGRPQWRGTAFSP
jgi:hypothetical protein